MNHAHRKRTRRCCSMILAIMVLSSCTAVFAEFDSKSEGDRLAREWLDDTRKGYSSWIKLLPFTTTGSFMRADIRLATGNAYISKRWQVMKKDLLQEVKDRPESPYADDILLALGRLAREDFDHHLVIVGRFEPEADSFHRFLRSITMKLGLMSSTTFLGMVPPEEVADIMNACDVGLFPFRDGVSLRRTSWIAAVMEDMPTVTTEPVKELPGLMESTNVRVVPRRNISGLVTAILEIGSNPKILQNMRLGESPLKSRFSWPDIASRTIDFYQLVARRKFDRGGERILKKKQEDAERREKS